MTGVEMRAIREAAGKTQAEAAELIGIHRVTYGEYERLGTLFTLGADLTRRFRLNIDPAFRRCDCCGGEGYTLETTPAAPESHETGPDAS